MAKQTILIGAAANDGTGDPIRVAMNKINQNTDEIYLAGPAGTNLRILGNELSSTNTDGNIALAPNGLGLVTSSATITAPKVISTNVTTNELVVLPANAPTVSTGNIGDVAGKIAWDTNFVYVCTADYDGVTNIWKRTPITTW